MKLFFLSILGSAVLVYFVVHTLVIGFVKIFSNYDKEDVLLTTLYVVTCVFLGLAIIYIFWDKYRSQQNSSLKNDKK